MKTSAILDGIDWAKNDGLVPAIVQDALTGQVLMLGYMNEASLKHTIETQQVTFFSRSKQRLWTKGESSGNTLSLVDIAIDCDGDTLLMLAQPAGPVCHLMTPTCFGVDAPQGSMLQRLAEVIEQRSSEDGDESYTRSLLASGVQRCAQKVGEEGVEVALAATSGDVKALAEESADLLYHLLVTLKATNTDLRDVLKVLDERHREPQSD